SAMVAPFQPIIEAKVNYDLFREKNIITPKENALNLSRRHTETASWLSQQIQKAAGIDARKIDYIIRSQFSYVGNEGLKAIDKVAEMSGAKEPNNHNDFDLTDLGLFKRSPAYNSEAVQEMISFAREWGLDRSKDYKEFQNLAGKYFDATTDEDKEDYANQLIDLSKLLLANWKASGVEDKAKAKKKKY
ncbi:MAG: LPD38 domain-containing protein, partial [Ginsengibacter sp.]